MSSSRLSDSDKRQIVELYRQPGETTLTLADRYGVSNTTISRILKSSLSPEEYDGLIQQKRFSSRSSGGAQPAAVVDTAVQGNLLETSPLVESEIAEPEPELMTPAVKSPPAPPIRRARRRSSVPAEESPAPLESVADLESSPSLGFAGSAKSPEVAQASAVEAILGEDLTPSGRGMLEDEDDLDDLDDLEDDLDDDLDDDGTSVLPSIQVNAAEFIRVLPIAEASIPRTCYLVVDRSAELVARPLREFAELGQIPSDEIQEKTLPVFDNHRVAKRFSNIRTQRVIKVPDSRVLQKAAPYLQAKGITRLLIDGQVYAF